MHWSKSFVPSLHKAMWAWLSCMTTNLVDPRSNNNENCQAEYQWFYWQQLPLLMWSAQALQDKFLVGKGIQLLTTINLIGDWTMGNGEAVCSVQLTHKQCRGFQAQGSRCCLFCTSRNTTTVDEACNRCWSQTATGQQCDRAVQWFCLPKMHYQRPMTQDQVGCARQ